MVLKLHGMRGSTCTQRVLLPLAEKGIPFEIVPINLFGGEQKQPAHLAKQPFGKIPVLEDDGYFLFESRAIAKYIAKKYPGQGTKLIPVDGDLKGYGLFEQACSIETSYFDGPATEIIYEKLWKGLRGLGGPDEAVVAKNVAALDTALAVYDGILAKQKYLAGDEISLADLYHIPHGKLARELAYEGNFAKFPHVEKWFSSLLARESWVEASS